jgi:hypothetical protein
MIGWVVLTSALLAATPGMRQPPGELIDRTLAIVAGQAITLSDVRAAVTLGLVDDAGGAEAIEGATQRLVERALMLREVQRYAPPEPESAAIESRIAAVIARFESAAAWRATLDRVGVSEPQLRAWVRDDLRIAAYLDQRFASAGGPERRAELVRDWILDIRRRTPVVDLKP